jgi:hypothetical protein
MVDDLTRDGDDTVGHSGGGEERNLEFRVLGS